MSKVFLTLLCAFGLLAGVFFVTGSDTNGVQAELKPIGGIEVLALRDLDGKTVKFGDSRLGDGKIAFCFMANWSDPSIEQAKEVLKAAEAFRAEGGTLVIICDGPESDGDYYASRDMRKKLDPNYADSEGKKKANIWLSPKHAAEIAMQGGSRTVDGKFAGAFRDLAKLDRIPALVISDQKGRVTFASHGRMTSEAIGKALGAN